MKDFERGFQISVVTETGEKELWMKRQFHAKAAKKKPAKNTDVLCALCELSLRPLRETLTGMGTRKLEE
jgi:hypothetical protein